MCGVKLVTFLLSYSPYFLSPLTYTAYLGPIRFTLDNMEFALNNMEFTLDNMKFTLDNMDFTLDNVEFTLDNMSPVLKIQLFKCYSQDVIYVF